MGDILLLIPVMAAVFVFSFVVIGVLAAIEGIDLVDLDITDPNIPGSIIVVPTLIQQAAWVGWPLVVSRWKGLGPAKDWGLSFRWSDLGTGLGYAMVGVAAAGAAALATGALVGLEEDSAADNTAVVSNLDGSPWLIGILFAVVIGAPISEELLFRGLILRSVAKRWGSVVGVIGSLLAFVPFHIADGGLFTEGQLVLWSATGTLGVILAICALRTGRLGAPIVAHVIVNAIGSIAALGVLPGADEVALLGHLGIAGLL